MKDIQPDNKSDFMSRSADQLDPANNIDEINGKYLTFWTDNQLFGIPISNVVQIVSVQKITQVPDFPAYAKGIIDIRGSIIPVIDVRIRFHKPEIAYNERTCIIVTKIQQNLIGFIVDSVDEVAKIETESISTPPKVSTENTDAYLTGIAKLGNKVVLLLNSERMLNNEEISDIVNDDNSGGTL